MVTIPEPGQCQIILEAQIELCNFSKARSVQKNLPMVSEVGDDDARDGSLKSAVFRLDRRYAVVFRCADDSQHGRSGDLSLAIPFFRGLTIAGILCLYLMAIDGRQFFNNFKKIGVSGVVGALGLVGAFIGFIWSITLTSAANTLFLFATMPFLAAFMGIVILREAIHPLTWVAMTVALIGIGVMVMEGLEAGSVLGTLTGFGSACCFAAFSVCLRYRKETPQFAAVALAGILCAILTACILFVHGESVLMPIRNVYLSMVHGTLVGLGLILFSLGAKYFPAAELNLLSLVEVVGGVIWVYLPIFGILEVPSLLTVVGGGIVSCAILLDSVGMRFKREMVNVWGNR